ncbi:MAG: carboxynorspermidine decarboxylase [Puniceicoccaceae bacterium]
MEARDLQLICQQTPESCFVIHKQALLQNLERIGRISRESPAKVLLALKGYACHATFDLIRPYVAGIAASSPHEAELGLRKMGGELHAYAPAYSDEDIRILSQWVDHIVFNSREQLLRYAPAIRDAERPIEMAVRLNPEQSEADTELYDPSAKASRLGIQQHEWNDDLLPWLDGIHVHNLCENDSHALERTLQALESRFSAVLSKVKWINMGGGHLITRKGYDVDHLIALLNRWHARYGHQIYLEPSEAFGWGTGVLKATVLDIKPGAPGDVPHAILNVSATAHMPDTLEMPYRAEIHGAGKLGEKTHGYRLGGVTCLAGDRIGTYSFDQPLQVGDCVLLMDMAHYTMVKTSFFNGVQMPAIAIFDRQTQSTRIVRTFGYEDYANKLA